MILQGRDVDQHELRVVQNVVELGCVEHRSLQIPLGTRPRVPELSEAVHEGSVVGELSESHAQICRNSASKPLAVFHAIVQGLDHTSSFAILLLCNRY